MEKRLSVIITVLVSVVSSCVFFVPPLKAQLVFPYIVTTTSDTVVAGACQAGNPQPGCSLRGAIIRANEAANFDLITFSIPASDPFCSAGVCTINLTSALPSITEPVSINGPGADRLIVKPGTGVKVRVFNVTATGTVSISGLTISNGSDTSQGAGIFSSGGGTVNVINCAVINNNTIQGGGIENSGGTMNISNSTISGNGATFGGGLANSAGGAVGIMNVTNSTISGNTANDTGGGIYNIGNGATLNVTNSTISGNSGSNGGGGIFKETGTINVKSSIIAMNTGSASSPDVSGNFVSAGFNLIGKRDGSAGFTAPTDMTGTIAAPLNPMLDPAGLQNNGGPTRTIALLLGSPAIDKGTSNGLTGNLTTDQRGSEFPRTFDDPAIPNATGGDGTDVGAFEVQTAAPPSPTPTPTPTATPTATPVTTLANISTRLRVETGDNVLIGGFIITGTQPKKVIVRGIGTSLSFPDKLVDPTLEFHGPSGLIDANDNWVDSPNKQAIIDSTIPPTSDLESAIVQTLPANNAGYTAIVRGANNGTGIGVVEAYDLDTTVDSKLANISTRGFVQTGDNVLIAGTIVVGQASQKVIIRAIGPSLSVPGKLGDPTLELRDSNGALLQFNDNWVDSADKQAIIDTTIPPTNDLESAIVATLPANNASYTAILRGVNDTTGIAVVEVYALN